MTLDEFPLRPGTALADAAQAIEEAIIAEGLRVTLRDTLAKYPGCIHWHLKRGKETGTLEITLLNRERRVELAVQAGRDGTWTEETLERLSATLNSKLGPSQ
jgi:hypothetical protein